MKSKLVYLTISGDKASIYSIVTEDSKVPFLDHFIKEHQVGFTQDLLSIISRLKSMGNAVGALEIYFKLDEGLEWDDLVCAFYDIPDKHLVSFPIIQPVHLELARRCIVNFKIYKHEKEAYRRPDSGRY